MAYIGQPPFQEFTSAPTKDSFTGDGSTTTFDLAQEVASAGENALEVFINNVRQEPGSGKAYTLGNDASGDNKRITFTAAPANGAAIYVLNDKTNLTSIAPIQTDFNGVEIILDADADTTLTADTDDRIDWKIAGVEHFSFSNSSGDTIIKPMVDAKDIKFQQYDGNVLLDINDGNYVGIGGNSSAPGEIRFYEDTDNGSLYTGFKAGNVTSSISYVLPLADGSANQQLTTDGSGTLSWANQGANPISADGDTLGTASLEWSDLFLADGAVINLGNDQDVTLTHVADTGVLLNSTRKIQFGDSATFIHQSADGVMTIDGEATIDLNASTAVLVSNDLKLNSDAAVLGLGADNDVTLTHVADTGILLNSTMAIQFNDASQYINAPSNAILDINATDEIELNATLVDVNANLDVSGTIVGASTLSATTGTFSGILKTDDTTEATSTTDGSLQTDGGLSVAKDAVFGDDVKLLSDAAVLGFGADGDVTLTHVADTGVLLNSTMKIQFNDASQFIHGSSNAILSLGATDEIDLTATAIDINGTCDISGTFSLGGTNITASAAELNYTDGVTSAIQTQIDTKSTKGFAIASAIVFG